MRLNHPYAKLACYLIAIIVLEFGSRSADITSETVSEWLWWDWLKFGVSVLGAPALAVRMFFDQSVTRHENNGKGATP
jgi:hypothetical protein